MIRVPGQKPHVAPPIQPKEAKPKEDVKPEVPSKPIPGPKVGSKGPELDARAIAVRMAAVAAEIKKKELSFEEIIEKAILETGLTNPDSAVEEASKKLQQEIEDVIEQIKENKDLMEEADSWQTFGELLEHELSEEQVIDFLTLLQETVKSY